MSITNRPTVNDKGACASGVSDKWARAQRQARRIATSTRKAQSIRTLCKHWREALGAKRG